MRATTELKANVGLKPTTDLGLRRMMEPKTVETKGTVQAEAKPKATRGGFASVKTTIAAGIWKDRY